MKVAIPAAIHQGAWPPGMRLGWIRGRLGGVVSHRSAHSPPSPFHLTAQGVNSPPATLMSSGDKSVCFTLQLDPTPGVLLVFLETGKFLDQLSKQSHSSSFSPPAGIGWRALLTWAGDAECC